MQPAAPLLTGSIPNQPQECVAWINTYKAGQVLFTSLGHQDDFKAPQFRRLLLNSIRWALDRAIPSSW